MADKALLRIGWPAGTAEKRKRAEQHRRRDLRIAIRQLERAELYLVALYSLDVGDVEVERAVDALIRDTKALRDYFIRARQAD